jgi:hypothetical protein
VLPGGVDVHTHLDADVGGLRSADDFESSTAAAACGGVTTICDYAWQQRGQSLTAAIEDWKTRAAGRAHVDYGFHVIVGDASDQTLAEIPRLVDLGYPSLKVFMINEFGIGDQGIMRVLDAARKVGVVVNVHAENGDMLDHCTRNLLAAGRRDPRYYAASRPVIAEAEATRRAIDYAELVDAEISPARWRTASCSWPTVAPWRRARRSRCWSARARRAPSSSSSSSRTSRPGSERARRRRQRAGGGGGGAGGAGGVDGVDAGGGGGGGPGGGAGIPTGAVPGAAAGGPAQRKTSA